MYYNSYLVLCSFCVSCVCYSANHRQILYYFNKKSLIKDYCASIAFFVALNEFSLLSSSFR